MRTREYSVTRVLRVFQKTDFFLFLRYIIYFKLINFLEAILIFKLIAAINSLASYNASRKIMIKIHQFI